MENEVLKNYLIETEETFESYKTLAEKALSQVRDEDFFRCLEAESNSIAVIVKHISRNLRSRWTDFLTADGEKSYRQRDSEFLTEEDSRESLMNFWQEGWTAAIQSISSLRTTDLGKIVKIRGEDFTVTKAVSRSLAHTASHVGQIIFLAKHFRAEDWQTLSIPRNKSNEFNTFLDKNKTGKNYLESSAKFVESEKKA